MNLILEILTVFTVCILPHIAASIFIIRDKEYAKKWSAVQRIISGWITAIASILLVIYIASNQANGINAMGLSLSKSELPNVLTVSGIATGYLMLIFVIAKFRSKKDQEKMETIRKHIFDAGGFASYKGFWKKSAYLGSLWSNVIAEDFVFRGYLVLGLGTKTGIFWPWAVLSVVLSLTVHLYQGANLRVMFGHSIFALIFITVTLITKNVYTAIIPHLVYDTVWLLRGWAKYSQLYVNQSESVG